MPQNTTPTCGMQLSSPGLAAPLPQGCNGGVVEEDAFRVRIRPSSGTSHAPRGAILYCAALELDAQASRALVAQGNGSPSTLQDDTGARSQRVQGAAQRPRSAKMASGARALQEGGACMRHHGMPEAMKTRMLLRDTASTPGYRQRAVHAVAAEELGLGGDGDAGGLDGHADPQERVEYRPAHGWQWRGRNEHLKPRQRVPSAVEGRYLRESVLESSLQRRCKSAIRQRARSATLRQQMKQLWGSLERAKPELRQPRRARAQFDEELPEWDRWRSLILIPTSSFQVAQRPVRSE